MKVHATFEFENGRREEMDLKHAEEYFDAIIKAMRVATAKNLDYSGDDDLSNIMACEREMGIPAEEGILVRLSDKWARIQNFFKTGTLHVKDEKVEDTIIDMINYLAMLYAVLRRKA